MKMYKLKLKELRKENGMTQKQIADLVNMSQTNYSKCELEKIEPDLNTLVILANYYDVSIDKLIGRRYDL